MRAMPRKTPLVRHLAEDEHAGDEREEHHRIAVDGSRCDVTHADGEHHGDTVAEPRRRRE